MRYLVESFVRTALRQGRTVEQFLGPCGTTERPGVVYVQVRPSEAGFGVWLCEVEDVGHEGFCDLGEFPPLDPEAEDGGVLLGAEDDPLAAVGLAERLTAAVRGRWVNYPLAGDEYRDFLRTVSPRSGRTVRSPECNCPSPGGSGS
ncbi:hypothetical protein [Actinokineospora enzanensis]|uniref:hypothetical protein n=1 Tax=Actinokineospora enzanensis TaxID=155975 RepID=UPI0012EBB7F1|nr:hypothetical protein [Actinokineospora enzanensis]